MNAAKEHLARDGGRIRPPGNVDSAGRFYAAERTVPVENARAPSRSWPYSELKSAKTAAHCAEVFGAKPLHVKCLAKTLKGVPGSNVRNHAIIAWMNEVRRILKPV